MFAHPQLHPQPPWVSLFMTWAFQSARQYGLQTCASLEYMPKAFRTRKGIAASVC